MKYGEVESIGNFTANISWTHAAEVEITTDVLDHVWTLGFKICHELSK